MDHQPEHVLIAGGGVAALEVALALRAVGEDRLQVELSHPRPTSGTALAVAEPFALGKMRRFELAELTTAAGGRSRMASSSRSTPSGGSHTSVRAPAIRTPCCSSPAGRCPGWRSRAR